MGCVNLAFNSGELDQECVENADKTHFILKIDNGRKLGIMGDNAVNYVVVVSTIEPMTMVVRITGGENAYMEPPFILFKNSNYSIIEVVHTRLEVFQMMC